MTPDFALSLSTDGICLLERADPDWVVLGQINLSDEDFEGRVLKLRSKALAKSSCANQVKLVIPNDQIKYYSIARPADTLTAEIEALITQSLANETPYHISELAFDWVTSRELIFVAAVTLQTLKEAENFAKGQGFKPLGNVSIPPNDKFIGEAFFGLSDGNQTEMMSDLEKINIANTSATEIRNKYSKTDPYSNNLTAPQDQTGFEQRGKTIRSVTAEGTLRHRTENIFFQSVRNIQLRPAKDDPVDNEISEITLIAPIDQDIPQALDSFKHQNRISSTFFGRLANHLYGNPPSREEEDNNNWLMNASFLPSFILFLATVFLVGTTVIYLTKPKLLDFVDQFRGPPAGPELTTNLVQPHNLKIQRQKIILTQNLVQSHKTLKAPLALPVSQDFTSRPKNPYADLTSQRPQHSERYSTAAKLVLKNHYNESELIHHYSLDNAIPLRLNNRKTRLKAPEKDKLLQFIEEKQHRIYTSTGIWSFSPKSPNFIGFEQARHKVSFAKDPIFQRFHNSSLEALNNLSTKINISNSEMPLKIAISLSPSLGDISNIPTIDRKKKIESENKILSKNPSEFLSFLLKKPRSSQMQQSFNASNQNLMSTKKPRLIIKDQKHQGNYINGLFTLAKPRAELPILQKPPTPSKPTIANPGQLSIAQPLSNIRPMSRPEENNLKKGEQVQANVLRPKLRPNFIKPLLPNASDFIISESIRPKKRPKNIKLFKTVTAARAFSPEDEGDEASVNGNAISIANNSRAGDKATMAKVLDLRRMNLIGVYLSSGRRSALIRLSSGKRVMVKIGDTLDGGKVAAIGDKELRYVKRGQNITLELPRG